MWKLLAALALAGAAMVLVAGLRTAADRAAFLRRAGLGLIAVFTLVAIGWIAAAAFTDPGGWLAAGIVALYLVPLVVLSALAWYRVAAATVLLAVLTAIVVGLSVWFAADPQAWRAFEHDNGPVRAVITVILAAPLAVLGWRRPRPAGGLLVVLGLAPVALSAVGTTAGLASLAAVSAPAVLAGILYLLAGTGDRRTPVPAAMPTAASEAIEGASR